MPRSPASPSSHHKTPFPQTLKKYAGGVPSPLSSVGRVVSGWEGVGSIFRVVLEGGHAWDSALHLPASIFAVTLSAFRFQDDKKKKVPSDLEKVSVLCGWRGGVVL